MKLKLHLRLLSLALVVCAVLPLISCAAPKLEDVKSTFTQLIEESLEVNEIIFGEGLSVYGDMSYDEEHGIYYSIFYTKEHGKLCAYYDKNKGEYVTLAFEDGAEDITLVTPIDYEYTDFNSELPEAFLPADYYFVRTDEVATSASEIAELAAKVYSEDYLADVFETLMGGLDESAVIIDEDFIPRYKEISDVESGKKYLVKASAKTCPPITLEVREYDLDSMTITKNSRKNFVSVEINSYGTYVDMDAGEIKTGWSTVTLSFVKQNGEWRLDTPTY